LLIQLTSLPHSTGNSKLWQNVDLEQEPHNKKTHYNEQLIHVLLLQPTAETTYAQENPPDRGPHEDDRDDAARLWPVLEEKIERSRSGFVAPHLGHLTGSLSL